jgi:hypothetical protein
MGPACSRVQRHRGLFWRSAPLENPLDTVATFDDPPSRIQLDYNSVIVVGGFHAAHADTHGWAAASVTAEVVVESPLVPRVGRERIHRCNSPASIMVVLPALRAVSSLLRIASKIRVRDTAAATAAASI